jgi:hypothetical protein
MENQYEKAIDNIIDTFDFEKVHAYMTLTGWKYWNTFGVPTVGELKATARRLLKRVTEQEVKWIESGGFRAELYECTEDPMELTLAFIIVQDSVYV